MSERISQVGRHDGCLTPPVNAELAALPRCATCGGVYPLQCPPHRTTPPAQPDGEASA